MKWRISAILIMCLLVVGGSANFANASDLRNSKGDHYQDYHAQSRGLDSPAPFGQNGGNENPMDNPSNFSWPKFRHDLNNTGVSSSLATNTNVPLWIRDLGAPIQASPTIADGVVYIGNMKWLETEFFALNALNGETLWNFPVDDYIMSSAAIADGMVFFGDRTSTDNFHALNITNGSEAWVYNACNGMHSSPAVSDGMVFFGSMLAGSCDTGFYALDEFSGAEIWNYSGIGAIQSTPVVNDGIVYLGTTEGLGRLLALDQYGSGGMAKLIWSFQCPLPLSWVQPSPVLADGMLYFGSQNGYFYALDKDGMFDGDQGVLDSTPFNNSDLIWKYDNEWPIETSAAYINGRIYYTSGDKLYALNASADTMSSEERLLWTFQAEDYIGFAPAIADGKIFFGSSDGHLYAISLESGELIWKYETGGSVASPAVGDGLVVVGSTDGNLYAFNLTGKPDLTLFEHDIQFIPSSTVMQGSQVTISAQIRNHGDNASESGLVAIYKDRPPFGYPLGTMTVGHLEILESETVSMDWTTLGSGPIEICVEISDVIPQEANAQNNLACSFLYVVAAPDLALSPLDIEFLPSPTVTSGTDVTIFATVHNYGDNTSDSATVTFYDGDPNTGAPIIDSRTVHNLIPGGSQAVWISWASPPVGLHSIFVNISDSKPPDSNLSNNIAYRTFTVKSEPDLSISSQYIEFMPSEKVTNGTLVLISATIRNIGGTECDSALVEFFEGNPVSGGTLIASRFLNNIPVDSGQTVSVYWTPGSVGSHPIYVRVSDVHPGDRNESNNEASSNLEVFSFPDLSISWSDITFSELDPLEGEEVKISIVVHNQGAESAANVTVRIFDGASQIGSDLTIYLIPGNGGFSSYDVSWTPSAGAHLITVEVDPEKAILESNENNNIAQSILSAKKIEIPDLWWIWLIFAAIFITFAVIIILWWKKKNEGETKSQPMTINSSTTDAIPAEFLSTCKNCGKELEAEYIMCPYCGIKR